MLFKYGKATKRTCHFFTGRFYDSICTILWGVLWNNYSIGYDRIVANLALRHSLVVYHFISSCTKRAGVWYPEMRYDSALSSTLNFLSLMQESRTNLGFKVVLTLQYQEMEHNLAPSTCTQTPAVLLAPPWAYSLFRVRIPGQCIPGTVAHRENLHNTRTRDICIGSGNSHPGLWLVLRCKNGQSTCTDL